MYKNLTNRRKVKRNPYKKKGGLNLISSFKFLITDDKKHKKDYAWKKSHYNPYKLKESISLKKKIELFILFFSSIILIVTIIYHPFFYIQNIEINGLQRINESDFVDSIYGILEYKKLFIFSGKSYVFTDVNEIKNILKERYPIKLIIVEKKFPQTVSIILEEKISTVIYDNGERYSYLGLDGNIVEIIGNVGDAEWNKITETTTTTLADGTIKSEERIIENSHNPDINRIIDEFGNYPIVYDSRKKKVEINQPILKSEIVYGIINWFNIISKKTDIPFDYIIIKDELGEGTIKIKEGWELKVNLLKRFQEQVDKLNLLLKEKTDRSNLDYIDLRYPDRAYWK